MNIEQFGKPVNLHDHDHDDERLPMARGYHKDDKLGVFAFLVADHVEAARDECAMKFLEEGLLPAIKKIGKKRSRQTVKQIAQLFVDEFKAQHPNDFDLTDPLSLIAIAEEFAMTWHFVAQRHKEVDKETLNLVEKGWGNLLNVLFWEDETY